MAKKIWTGFSRKTKEEMAMVSYNERHPDHLITREPGIP